MGYISFLDPAYRNSQSSAAGGDGDGDGGTGGLSLVLKHLTPACRVILYDIRTAAW